MLERPACWTKCSTVKLPRPSRPSGSNYYYSRHERVKVRFWDTAGEERFNAVSKVYFRGVIAPSPVSARWTRKHARGEAMGPRYSQRTPARISKTTEADRGTLVLPREGLTKFRTTTMTRKEGTPSPFSL